MPTTPKQPTQQLQDLIKSGDVAGALCLLETLGRAPQEILQKALLAALRCAGPEVVDRLLERGADVNADNLVGRTALHFAVAERRSAHVPALLMRDAAPNVQDLWGYTPLHEAAFWGDAGVIDQLLAAGANPGLVVQRGPHAGASALTLAKGWGRHEAQALLETRNAPDGQLPAQRRMIPRDPRIALKLSVSKLPQKTRADFRTRYTVPLAPSGKTGSARRGYGLPLMEYRVSLSAYSRQPILEFYRRRQLPGHGEGTIPRCICCGSRQGVVIYSGSGVSGNATIAHTRPALWCKWQDRPMAPHGVATACPSRPMWLRKTSR